eukprot:3556321-Rhodomonas_salina.1
MILHDNGPMGPRSLHVSVDHDEHKACEEGNPLFMCVRLEAKEIQAKYKGALDTPGPRPAARIDD